MKKLILYLIFFLPIIARSQNLPPPGLPDEPVTAPINSMIFVLFSAAIAFGGYTVFKKK